MAKLTGLIYLQTFGNNFTDRGVQQLATLVNLGHLYLEEETLTVAAFEFVERLPHLTKLGLQDIPLSRRDFKRLRDRLPGVDIGWRAAIPRERRLVSQLNSDALRLCRQRARASHCTLELRRNRKVDLDNNDDEDPDLRCEHE